MADEERLPDHLAAELFQAEVAHLLGSAGIPTLTIKGPTVARWLYPHGGRRWGDNDVWVPRRRADDAIAVLRGHGFREKYAGVDHHTSDEHSVVLDRPGSATGGSEIDLHHRFPGADADPEDVFDELWRRREPVTFAHTAAWAPDRSTRALLVVLHSARSEPGPQVAEDLRRVVAPDDGGGLPGVDWEDVTDLAHRVGAVGALRAGLGGDPGGARVVASVPRLVAARPSDEWLLRVRGSSRTAVRLAQLRASPAGGRARLLARWVVPHPASLRVHDPRAASGRPALLVAYARRAARGAAAAPAALREWLRTSRV